jgi:hypothetical protein
MQKQNPCKPGGTQQVDRPAIDGWIQLKILREWESEIRDKVTGSGPMASNHKRGHGSSCTVAPKEYINVLIFVFIMHTIYKKQILIH